jgi:hypothetical protein
MAPKGSSLDCGDELVKDLGEPAASQEVLRLLNPKEKKA